MDNRSPGPRARQTRGFTIIESAVVLLILGILTVLILALIKNRMEPEFPSQPEAAEVSPE